MCFSATYTTESVRDIEINLFKRAPSNKVLIPESHEDDKSSVMVATIDHMWIDASTHDGGKIGLLEDLYDLLQTNQSIVFFNTRKEVQRVEELLLKKGFATCELRGDMATAQRDAAMATFKAGKARVLLTTNVLSRGIDVPSVNMVINYDLPLMLVKGQRGGEQWTPDPTTYIHRVGRTGRAGAHGVAINFVGSSAAAPGDKAKDLGNLETLEKHCYPKEVAEKGKWSMFRQVPADDVEQIKAMVKTKI